MLVLQRQTRSLETTNLATGGLGIPQGPLILERMFDVEIILVMENGLDVAVRIRFGGIAVGRDRDRGKIDLLIHLGAVNCGSHCG